jgi:hypothetical protein
VVRGTWDEEFHFVGEISTVQRWVPPTVELFAPTGGPVP